MAWRDNLKQGSFRGVPFETFAVGNDIGRRVALHEYPERDLPYAEDIGKAARGFQVECFVVGDDYHSKRDELIEALEKKGPGTLVHPYWGNLTVQVQSARVSEDSQEGRLAKFSISFVESGKNETPNRTVGTASRVGTSASGVLSVVSAAYARITKITGVASFIQNEALDLANDALNVIDALQSFPGDIASFVFDTPQSIADQFATFITSITEPDDVRALWNYGDAFEQPGTATANRAIQQDNQNIFTQLIRTLAIARVADQQATGVFALDNATAAIQYRDEIAAEIDEEMATAPDDVFAALSDLRADIVNDINERVAVLPKLRTLALPETLPALVAAYNIYYDSGRESDIIARNRPRNPGFLHGNIEYLEERAA